MKTIDELTALLKEALQHPDRLSQKIRQFQEDVWSAGNAGGDSAAWEVLRELTYDLEFFVPDEKMREEDVSYYGPDRAAREIREALEKISKLQRP